MTPMVGGKSIGQTKTVNRLGIFNNCGIHTPYRLTLSRIGDDSVVVALEGVGHLAVDNHIQTAVACIPVAVGGELDGQQLHQTPRGRVQVRAGVEVVQHPVGRVAAICEAVTGDHKVETCV